MEEIIIRLRKFSLRWAIVIMLVATIITSILGNLSYELLKLATFILFIASSLFYATWCAQAVTNVKKAYRTLSVIIVTSFLNTVWGLLSEPIDVERMNSLNTQIYMSATSSYPTSLLQSLASAAAFIYSFSSVNQKYRLCWGGMIIIFLLTFMNLFVLVTGAATIDGSGVFYHGVDTFINANMIIGVLALILYIVLLIKGNNNSNGHMKITPFSPNNPHSATINAYGSTSNTMKIGDQTQQLFKLKELLDAGILTQEEFNAEKSKILNK